jgi:hypothetical protein
MYDVLLCALLSLEMKILYFFHLWIGGGCLLMTCQSHFKAIMEGINPISVFRNSKIYLMHYYFCSSQ